MALGVILTPYGHTPGYPPSGIAHNHKGATSWAEPFDPQHYTRGEAGYYYDTPLGRPRRGLKETLKGLFGLGVPSPTDFELSRRYGFQPVKTGWVTTDQGFQSGWWRPQHGDYPGRPAALWPPVTPCGRSNGLGQALPPAADMPPPATAEDVLVMMAAHNDRVFALTLVSTTAVALSALITLFRTLKLIKTGQRDS